MTSKLTDMQLVLLATACQRDDGSLLPPPARLGDQAARIRKAVAALIKRTFASECDIADTAKAWREEDDRHIGVVITDAGRAVIAAEEADESSGTPPETLAASQDEPGSVGAATSNPELPAAADPPAEVPSSAEVAPVPRTGTKQALVLELLEREGGASLDEMVAATSWLPHTTRAALTGLRKKGHAIVRIGESGASRYFIGAND